MDTKERTFADGFIFKRNEKAPDFVVGRLSIKVDEAIAFMRSHSNDGWINLDIKYGRTGNAYVELDTFKPKSNDGFQKPQASKPKTKPQVQEEDDDDELPF